MEVLNQIGIQLGQVIERGRAAKRLRDAEAHDLNTSEYTVPGQQGDDERLSSVLGRASDVIWVLDEDGTVRYVNPAIERVLGYRRDDFVGTMMFGYVHPDDREHAVETFKEALKAPGIYPTVAYRVRTADGHWRHVEVIRNNSMDDPRISGVVSDVRDITKRVRVEEALKESEERYRALVERIPVITYIQELASPRRITYLSPQYEEILGYSIEEGLSEPEHPINTLHPEDRQRVLEEDRRTNETGEPFAMEYRKLAKGGRVVWIRDEAKLVRNDVGEPLYWLGVQTDVTGRKRMEEQLKRQALHDPLTGLPNRKLLSDRLARALERTPRTRGRKVAVLFLDLDDFKHVNDSLGHEAGDRLLVAVAERLRSRVRSADTLARFGGDEFVVLLEEVEGPETAVGVAERINEGFSTPITLEGWEHFVSASVGIAIGDAHTAEPGSLLREADAAMYEAKREGRSYSVFSSYMHEWVLGRLVMGNDLRRAIERGELVVHYQPILELSSGGVLGVEALVRWNHPERGLIPPMQFIPLAEEMGLIASIDRWVMQEACTQVKRWNHERPGLRPLWVAVNVSARELRSPNVVHTIEEVLRECELAPELLHLEITESAFLEAGAQKNDVLGSLRAMGVRLSVDDFGTGYSSLAYLKRLPATTLKLDRAFVRGIRDEQEDRAIAQTIVDLAHILGMEVVAEGVEVEEQETLLKGMGCNSAQGYHFARPLPPEEVPGFLAKQRSSD